MFDRKQFTDEITAQLKDVPGDKCVAFAVRSAMRVLPLLVATTKGVFLSMFTGKNQNREAFWFWETKYRNKYLLVVFRAYSCSIGFVLTGIWGTDPSSVAAAVRAVARTNVNADYVAPHVIDAASPNANATDNAFFAAYYAFLAANYRDYAFLAADTDDIQIMKQSLIEAMQQDLVMLKKLSAEKLLLQPLWSEVAPYILVTFQQPDFPRRITGHVT